MSAFAVRPKALSDRLRKSFGLFRYIEHINGLFPSVSTKATSMLQSRRAIGRSQQIQQSSFVLVTISNRVHCSERVIVEFDCRLHIDFGIFGVEATSSARRGD